MKKNYISCLLLVMYLVFSTASAQDVITRLDPYWVIEGNLKTPKHSIVYFYNAENNLMYRQIVSGKKLNVNRVKVQRKLNEILKEINTAWQTNRMVKDSIIIANRF